jgi:hypothetical protein
LIDLTLEDATMLAPTPLPLKFPAILLFFGLSLTAASCGGPPGHYPVSGKVLCNGHPAEGLTVEFIPKGDFKGGNPHIAHGATDENGNFTLDCRDGPGAMPGEYWVTLRLFEYATAMARKERAKKKGVRSKSVPEDLLKGAFRDLQHPKFSATVQAGKTELEPFEMQLDQKTYDLCFKAD